MTLAVAVCRGLAGMRPILHGQFETALSNWLWNIERGDSLPDAFLLEVLAAEYGTTATFLLEGEQHETVQRLETVRKNVEAVQVDGFVYVPLFDINVSAGGGAFNDIEAVIATRHSSAFISQAMRNA